MALAGVMMAQAMMMYKTHLKKDDYDRVCKMILEHRDHVGEKRNNLSKYLH